MESLHLYLGSSHNLWKEYHFTPRLSVDVTELWLNHTSTESHGYTVKHRNIDHDRLQQWLDPSAVQDQSTHSRQIRTAWITTSVKQRRLDIAPNILEQILQSFGQKLAYDSCASSFAGIAELPTSTTGVHSGYICIHPKLLMTWSREPKSNTTNMTVIAEHTKIEQMKGMLNQSFIQQVSSHDLIAPLICALLCSVEVDRETDMLKQYVRGIEARTGHHSWKARIENPANGDLLHLSAKVSGYRMKSASCLRKLEVLSAITEFILTRLAPLSTHRDLRSTDDQVKSYIELLQDRSKMQKVTANFIQNRVQTQFEALLHLINENDALISHSVANSSRLLALASQQDSSSMKSLAVVTMFFLPGTFVSSLLSMPLFDWDNNNNTSNSGDNSGDVAWRHRLAIYFAIAGPLTVLTLAVWGLWTFVNASLNRRRTEVARRQLMADNNTINGTSTGVGVGMGGSVGVGVGAHGVEMLHFHLHDESTQHQHQQQVHESKKLRKKWGEFLVGDEVPPTPL